MHTTTPGHRGVPPARAQAQRRFGTTRGAAPLPAVVLLIVALAAAAAAQNQIVGGHLLDGNLMAGSLGLNAPVYRPGSMMNSQSIGRVYTAAGRGTLAAPNYGAAVSARTPVASYRYQTPGGSGTQYLIRSRTGVSPYVDPLASQMYSPLQGATTIQRYDPRSRRTTGIQIQPYGGLASPMYSPYR